MDNKIDLSDILDKHEHFQDGVSYLHRSKARECMKEAVRQALVLASKKARIKRQKKSTTVHPNYDEITHETIVDKQSILNVNDLVV